MDTLLHMYQTYLQILHPIAPITDIRNVRRFPYRRAKGCQKSSPHPRKRNIYPVPSFSVDTDTPDASDNGTRTEYTVDTAMPTIQVYLHIQSDSSPLSYKVHIHIGTY
jgi:hypothetical protein